MISKATEAVWRLMNRLCYKLLFQVFFAVRLHVLLADFLLFVSRPTDTPHRTMICHSFFFTFCTRCQLSLFFVSCLSVSIKIFKFKKKDTQIHLTVTALNLGPIFFYRAHSPAQRKKAVNEDWQFCCYFMLKAGSIPRRTYL